MNIKRVTYFALATLFSVASCSKEATEPAVFDWVDGEIYFKTSLSNVAYSRAQDMTLDRLESFQVTCFNSADRYKDQAGFLSPYFENATFIKKSNPSSGTVYVSSPSEGPKDWPETDGLLRFFAFSPSITAMSEGNSILEGADRSRYFNLINSTDCHDSQVSVGYRLGTVRINHDISQQFDFVTAEASGDRWKDFTSGVELAFSHQLCQVELKAWGAGSDYDFEIAGVRIGNSVVEGEFVFADDDTPANARGWARSDDEVKDRVEYLYRSAEISGTIDHLTAGDRIVRINSLEHNTPESAGSIMGQGGCAMVIPTVNPRWEGAADPNIGKNPYNTDRMYFSVLLRATDAATDKPLYPYPGNPYGMKVVYYAIDRSGTVITRLYPGETEGGFFTDPQLQNPYVASEGEEIKDFGWAAVPVDADWSAGKRYIYTLNYSEGIGLHDPDDPEPGKPIAGNSSIEWGVSVDTWTHAAKDENYDPDLDIPGFDE